PWEKLCHWQSWKQPSAASRQVVSCYSIPGLPCRKVKTHSSPRYSRSWPTPTFSITTRNSTRMCSEKNCWSRPTAPPSGLRRSHSKSVRQANHTGSSPPPGRGFNPLHILFQQNNDRSLVFIVPSEEIGIISTKFVHRQGRFSWR